MFRSIVYSIYQITFFLRNAFFWKWLWVFSVPGFISEIGNEFLNLSWRFLTKTIHFLWIIDPLYPDKHYISDKCLSRRWSGFFTLMRHMLYQMFHLEDNHAEENKLPRKWTFTELVGILVWTWDGLILPLSGSEYLNLFFMIVVIMSCARNCWPSAPSVIKSSESFRVKCL